MSQLKAYILVEGKDSKELTNLVTGYVSAGWALHGQPFVTTKGNVTTFLQAVTLSSKKRPVRKTTK